MAAKKGKPKVYTDADRVAALAALAANAGNLSKTARQCGVPRNTLRAWAEGQPTFSPAAPAEPPPTPPSTPKKSVADRAAAALPAAAANLADRFEALAGRLVGVAEEKLAQMNPKDAVIAAGVAVDKMRLLREQATSISSNADLTDDERLRRLHELAERARRRRGERAAG